MGAPGKAAPAVRAAPSASEAWAARSAWTAWAAWGALATAAVATILVLGRGWRFFYDEWGLIEYRRSGGAAAFLPPHDGHLMAVPLLVYRALFATVGLTSYTPYRVVIALAHVGLGALVFSYLRPRLPAVAALAGTGVFLFLGSAWEVLYWMVTLGYVLPMICLVGGLLLADRVEGPRTAPMVAGLATVALASSGLGLGVTAALMVDAARRRDRIRRWLWLAAPLAGWLVWFVAYRPHTGTPAALRAIPGSDPNGDVGQLGYHGVHPHTMVVFSWRMVGSAAAGLFGAGGTHWWCPTLLALVLVAGVMVGRGVADPGRVAALLVGAVVYVGSVALARAVVDQPYSSRYIYPGVVFYLLLAGEAWKGTRGALAGRAVEGRSGVARAVARAGVRPAALVAVVLVAAAAVSFNIRIMSGIGGAALVTFSQQEVEQARLSCPGARPAPAYQPDPARMPGLRAGPYLAAVRELGSPVPASTVRRVCVGTVDHTMR